MNLSAVMLQKIFRNKFLRERIKLFYDNCANCGASLPTLSRVYELWDEYAMPQNIRLHSQLVSKVAIMLGDWCLEAGQKFDRQFLKIGGLLHDIAKGPCLDQPGKKHHLEGEIILQEKGYSELAYLVRYHVGLPEKFEIDEVALVFYADKRVMSHKIVGLDERFAYILDHYGNKFPERRGRLEEAYSQAQEVERLLFKSITAHTPADVATAVLAY